MTNHMHASDQPEAEREPGTSEDGEALPPAAIDPGTDDRGKGIPPLPEPDAEGVGEESGPSAGKTGAQGEKLSPEEQTMIKDGTGF
jgi:hypothetical protein